MKNLVHFRIIALFTGLVVLAFNGIGQGSESFDNSNATATYLDGSFIGDNGFTWTYGHSRNEGDFPIDGKGLMLRRASDSYLEAIIPGGVGNFSFQYRKAFTGTAPRELELIVNGIQVATTPVFGDLSGEDETVFTLNVEDIDEPGDVTIKIKNVGSTTTNRQVTIDNISWTGFSNGVPTVVAPVFNPPGGVYFTPQLIQITTITEEATVFYSLIGQEGPWIEYTDEILVEETTTIWAYAVKDEMNDSNVSSATYTFPEPAYTSLPYQETFDNDLGDCFTFSVSGDTRFWNWNSGGWAQMNGFDSGDIEEDWLILPGIDFTAYDDVTMTFDAWYRFGTDDEDNFLKLLYSANYEGLGNPTLATWSEIIFEKPSSENSWENTGNIDLSVITGSSVWIAFKYRYEPGSYRWWQIDNINIFEGVLPVLEVSPASLTGFFYVQDDGPSAAQAFQISGENLDNSDVVITTTSDYELSESGTGAFGPLVTLTSYDGSPTNIWVRLTEGLTSGTYSEQIIVSGGGADDQPVQLSGRVIPMPPGLPYSENFAEFNSTETIPFTWYLSDETYNGDWGTGFSAGLRGNANVLGYQHTAATGIFTADLILQNNTGETVDQLFISYMGMVERVGEERSPEWTVKLNDVNIPELFYSTVSGVNEEKSILVTGLNILQDEIITISWSSDRGLPAGSSKQIGIGDVFVGLEEPDEPSIEEPSNHVENFTAQANTPNIITLSWDHNDGVVPAGNYLILAKKVDGEFYTVTDGVFVENDLDWSDNRAAINISRAGDVSQSYQWTGLNPSTVYDFLIYPYNGTGSTVNYKTDEPVPAASTETGALAENVWIAENIQNWTSASYGDHTQTILVGEETGTVTMIDCWVRPDQEGSGTASTGFVQMRATVPSILELPEVPSVSEVEFRMSAFGEGRTIVLQKLTDEDEWEDLVTFTDIGTVGATFTYDIFLDEPVTLRLTIPSSPVKVHDIFVYKYIEPSQVSAPTFSPNGGTFYNPVLVSIETVTPDAEIYYSLIDEPFDWIRYADAIEIGETTTIWSYAEAEIEGELVESDIVSATFTFPELITVATIAELREGLTDGTLYRFNGEAVVTFAQEFRNQKWIQDETAAILIDDFPQGNIQGSFAIGDGISDIIGSLSVFNNTLQITPVTDASDPFEPTIILEPSVISMEQFLNNFEDFESQLVTIEGVSFTAADGILTFSNGGVYQISDGTLTGDFRATFFDVNYIGEAIPVLAQNITGILNERTLAPAGKYITARNLADFEMVLPDEPTVFVDPVLLSGFSYLVDSGPSAEQTFTVSGLQLTDDVVIESSTNYEISLNTGTGFTNLINLTPENGIVDETTIFVRLKENLPAGDYSEELVLITSVGAEDKTIICNGFVAEPFNISYFNEFRTQTDIEIAQIQGFVIENAQNESGAGGYLRIFPGGFVETPVIDFTDYDELTLKFDARTFGGDLGQTLSVKISANAGIDYELLESFSFTADYETFSLSIDLTDVYNVANGKMKIEMTDGGGSTRFRDFFLGIPIEVITVDIKVILEGAFSPSQDTLMRTTLNADIPLNQPYGPELPYFGNNNPKWYYTGDESVDVMPANVVDWVLVELRDATAANQATVALAKQAALLLNTGHIVDTDGQPIVFDVEIEQGLYVVVYHRNHLGVMSSQALPEIGGIYTWDFTQSLDKAYVREERAAYQNGQKPLPGGFFGMYGGDGDGDGQVLLQDLLNV
ncbi:MAG: hypothetical protein EA393_09155, partial [Bacteroidetes bacterium]